MQEESFAVEAKSTFARGDPALVYRIPKQERSLWTVLASMRLYIIHLSTVATVTAQTCRDHLKKEVLTNALRTLLMSIVSDEKYYLGPVGLIWLA
jgi:hypothetical protein